MYLPLTILFTSSRRLLDNPEEEETDLSKK